MTTGTTVDHVALLRAAPAFNGLEDGELAAAAASAELLSFDRDERLTLAGGSRDDIFVVVDGVIEAVSSDDERRWLLAPDSFCGTELMSASETMTATCETIVLRVDRPAGLQPHPRPSADVGVRVGLLAAQNLAAGAVLALVAIGASAIFLERFGPGLLPVVYLAVAPAGALLGAGLQRLQRRVRLTTLVVGHASVVTGLLVACWALLAFRDAAWVSFALLMLFRLELQAELVLVGGQAGRLLDVRQIKRHHPRIGSGLAAGFLLGGALTVPVLTALGRPEHLLAVAAAAAGVLAVIAASTAKRYRSTLDDDGSSDRTAIPVGAAATAKATDAGEERGQATLRSLLRHRYVALLFAFQVLSAAGSQLIDYLLYERAAARYTSEVDLAGFLGGYTVVLNAVDIVFLVAAAGILLGRFGIRYGLLANSATTTALLIAAGGVAVVNGFSSTAFFVLIASVRIIDISLNDGATISSINAAYQPLPLSERLRTQIGVEGVGVPLAVGATGAVLLVVNALPVSQIAVLTALTVAVGIAWTAVGLLTYRHYRNSVVERVRADEATAPGEGEPDATAQLIVSHDPELAARGLDRLAKRADPAYGLHLLEMTAERPAEVRALAVTRLGALRAPTAERVVTSALDDPDPMVRAAAVGARHRTGVLGRDGAMAAMDDPDPQVAAVAAACVLDHDPGDLTPRALEVLVGALTDGSGVAAPTVISALASDGDVVVAFLQRALAATIAQRPAPGLLDALSSLAAAARFDDPDRAAAALLPYLGRTDARLGHGLAVSLTAAGYRAEGSARETVRTVLAREIAFGRSVVAVLAALGAERESAGRDQGGLRLLHQRLSEELERLGERMWTLLALLYGREPIAGARAKLHHTDHAEAAMAAEALEVLVDPALRRAVTAVVAEDLPLARRARLLDAPLPPPSSDPTERVRIAVDGAEVEGDDRLRREVEAALTAS